MTPAAAAPAGGEQTSPALPAGPEPPSWGTLARSWAACAAVVLATTAITALVVGDWLGGSTRELPNDPLLMADILVNNLLLAAIPLLGGWLAAGQRLAGRPRLAWLFIAIAAAVVVRSLVTIGAVGGADPAWLAAAARWWLLEIAALGASAQTGLWLARHPHLRAQHGPAAVRRAAGVVVVALSAATLIEVLSA